MTAPYGSVNSRVFDSLASGAMVISNGEIGLKEIFGPTFAARGLKLPLFDSGEDLANKLDYYLTHEKERLQITSLMQEIVLEEHSYLYRAKELKTIIQNTFNINFLSSNKAVPDVTTSASLYKKTTDNRQPIRIVEDKRSQNRLRKSQRKIKKDAMKRSDSSVKVFDDTGTVDKDTRSGNNKAKEKSTTINVRQTAFKAREKKGNKMK